MATSSEADIGTADDRTVEDTSSEESDAPDAESVEAAKRIPSRGRVGRWPANDYY